MRGTALARSAAVHAPALSFIWVLENCNKKYEHHFISLLCVPPVII